MLYFLTWLNGDRLIAEQEFDDLFAARDFLFAHRQEYQVRGATSGRVWNDRATIFQVEWNDEGVTRCHRRKPGGSDPARPPEPLPRK